MAEIAKKLYIRKSDGTCESAKIYNTTDDLLSGKPFLRVWTATDGSGYVQLDDIGAANATEGRIYYKDGITYQICSTAYTPVNYYVSYGDTTGGTDFAWSNLVTSSFYCHSSRTVSVAFTANWYNANSTETNESHIRLLINGVAVITWLDYSGVTRKNKSATVNVNLDTGTVSVAIQYYKPKFTYWKLISATISITE